MSRLRAQILCLLLGIPVAASAQTLLSTGAYPLQLADRGPVFYAVSAGGAMERLDAAHTAGLARRIALRLNDASIPDALRAIEEQTGLRFAYDRTALASGTTVTLHADDITVAAALTQVLFDANVDVDIGSGGLASIRPRRAHLTGAQQQTGTIEGRVTDAKTGAPISHATVLLEGTKYGATTSDGGEYRIANVPAGSYALVVRLIGYVATRQPTNVAGDQTVRVSLSLTKSINELERVVTTGTVVPTEVKALPTPITVVTDSDIANEQAWSIAQVIRQAVPSAFAFETPTSPNATVFTIRGASTLNPIYPTMKVYVDGVELTGDGVTGIDPASVDHMEIIRGPEAATIYGADAIDGVMQVFTKRGDATLARPQVDLQTGLGVIQSAYPGYSGALRQDYSGSVQGGTTTASYGLGGGYAHNGDWVLQGGSGIPSLWGGFHVTQGSLALDFSGRYYAAHSTEATNPDLASTGFVPFLQPSDDEYQSVNQTYGVHAAYTATSWWHHELTVGLDRVSNDGRQTMARLTTPSDTLLYVSDDEDAKVSFAYNTSLDVVLTRALTSITIAGVDHYDRQETGGTTEGATTTVGTIESPGGAPALIRSLISNTGVFLQEEIEWNDALFVTLGVRGDVNSSFGSSIGTPVSPRYGVSYVRPLGATTLKLRGSFGEAINPPNPYLSDAKATPPFYQLANPLLGPERQRGWDAGVDWIVGRLSLSGTYYDQLATDLIEDVPTDTTGLVTENENIGRVRNSGIELESGLIVGSLEAHGQYAYTNARVEALGSQYTGDLRVGEQAFGVPHSTAGISARLYTVAAHSRIGRRLIPRQLGVL